MITFTIGMAGLFGIVAFVLLAVVLFLWALGYFDPDDDDDDGDVEDMRPVPSRPDPGRRTRGPY